VLTSAQTIFDLLWGFILLFFLFEYKIHITARTIKNIIVGMPSAITVFPIGGDSVLLVKYIVDVVVKSSIGIVEIGRVVDGFPLIGFEVSGLSEKKIRHHNY
jgi:hypothetical protein